MVDAIEHLSKQLNTEQQMVLRFEADKEVKKMRIRSFVVALAFVVSVLFVASFLSAGTEALNAGKETCFYKSEKVDGLNKICYYDCPSGKAAITVKSHQLCPLSIKKR